MSKGKIGVRAGGKVFRLAHNQKEISSILMPAIYNMKVYPAGFTVQEADKSAMRPFWKKLGIIV